MSATPPLRKLEYVLAVARELHFRRAAERVHVVQSSLSRQVREFEAELGFEIFYRNNHLVDLTDAGRAFTLALEDSLTRFLAEFTRARDLSRLISRRNATSCLIGYSPFVPATLRHEIRSIRKLRFPSVRLQFRLATESEMADSLGSGVFQAGVTFAPARTKSPATDPVAHRTSVRRVSSRAFVKRKWCNPACRAENTSPDRSVLTTRASRAVSVAAGQCVIAGFKPNIVEEVTSTQEYSTWCRMGSGQRSYRPESVMKCPRRFNALPFMGWKHCSWCSSTGTEAPQRHRGS